MQKKFSIAIMIVSLVFLAATAQAQGRRGYGQELRGFTQGNWELTLVGSGSSDEDFDGTTLSAEAGIGYFIADQMELVLRQGIAFADRPGDNDWNGSTRVAFDYHFNVDPVYPFIGVNLGYLYGDTVEEQFVAGPEAGIKYLVNDSAFLFGLMEYEVLFDDADEVDDNFDDGRFVYSIGIGFTF